MPLTNTEDDAIEETTEVVIADLQSEIESLQVRNAELEEAQVELEALQARNAELEDQVDVEALQTLQAENASLKDHNDELEKAVDALEKGAKKAIPPKPVKMEKPGKFYSLRFKLDDPYSTRTFYPDSSKPTEVRPMTSWVDCQIKAGVLIRAE